MCLLLPDVRSKQRLAIYTVLRMRAQGVVLLAPVCSSWSSMSRASSGRRWWNPDGFTGVTWVRDANVMVSRVTLLLWLCHALGLTFVLEQPSGSMMAANARFEQLCLDQIVIYRITFWMAHYGARSPKRTIVWSNSYHIRQLCLGVLTKAMRQGMGLTTLARTRNGRYTGVKRALRQSQSHGYKASLWAGVGRGWPGLAGVGWGGLAWGGLGWAGVGWAGVGWGRLSGLGWAGVVGC